MAINGRGCKEKGSRYEREVADYLNDNLFKTTRPIYRTPLSGAFAVKANVGMADLTGTPGLWFELKRTERCTPHEFMSQAVRGTTAHGNTEIPIVVTRRNKQSLEDSLCMIRLKDFLPFYQAWLSANGFSRSQDLNVDDKAPIATTE